MRRRIEYGIKSKTREGYFLNPPGLEFPDLTENDLRLECGKRQKTLSWSHGIKLKITFQAKSLLLLVSRRSRV